MFKNSKVDFWWRLLPLRSLSFPLLAKFFLRRSTDKFFLPVAFSNISSARDFVSIFFGDDKGEAVGFFGDNNNSLVDIGLGGGFSSNRFLFFKWGDAVDGEFGWEFCGRSRLTLPPITGLRPLSMIAVVFISSGTGCARSNFSARRMVGIFSLGGVISIGLILNLSGVVGVLLVGDLSPSS